jgi:hypothetical protein
LVSRFAMPSSLHVVPQSEGEITTATAELPRVSSYPSVSSPLYHEILHGFGSFRPACEGSLSGALTYLMPLYVPKNAAGCPCARGQGTAIGLKTRRKTLEINKQMKIERETVVSPTICTGEHGLQQQHGQPCQQRHRLSSGQTRNMGGEQLLRGPNCGGQEASVVTIVVVLL